MLTQLPLDCGHAGIDAAVNSPLLPSSASSFRSRFLRARECRQPEYFHAEPRNLRVSHVIKQWEECLFGDSFSLAERKTEIDMRHVSSIGTNPEAVQGFVMAPKPATIGLVMIAKNEVAVIGKACRSVAHLIDHYTIILDAESNPNDSSEDEIVKALGDRGQIFYESYVNVSDCRNRCIAHAEEHTDYLLALDADDTIEGDCDKSQLTADIYNVRIEDSNCTYWRPILFRSNRGCHYEGVVHEFLTSATPNLVGMNLPSLVYRRGFDGDTWSNPELKRLLEAKVSGLLDDETYEQLAARERQKASKRKYAGHAALLKRELAKDPSNTRNMFYYAQSLKDAGETEQAIAAYRYRAEMGGWDQEVFVSYLTAGALSMRAGQPADKWAPLLTKACIAVPARAPEALVVMAEGLTRLGDRFMAYVFAKASVGFAIPSDALFVDEGVYTWRNALTYGVCAFDYGLKQEARVVLSEMRSRFPADQLATADEIIGKCQ